MDTPLVEELPLREQICAIGRLMRQYDYVDSTSGNISARLDNDHVLITATGLAKGHMRPDHLIVVNMDGKRVDFGNDSGADLKPSSELVMHLECYRRRPDVGGVIHAHPPYAVALTIAGISLQQQIIPEAVVLFGNIPTTAYATPGTPENGDAIRELIARHNALMLANHGSLTVAATVWKAYLQLEALEQVAKTTFYTQLLGGAHQLAPEQIEKLVALRRSLGYSVY